MDTALVTPFAARYLKFNHTTSTLLPMVRIYLKVHILIHIVGSNYAAIKGLFCCLKISPFLDVLLFGDEFKSK